MFTTVIESLLALLFPDRCVGCQTLGALLCANCCAALQPYPPQPVAGLDDALVAFVFDGPLRQAIHQLKYHKQRRMAAPLAELMLPRLRKSLFTADAVLPVPLHSSRQRERGFNQSELLARPIAARAKLPMLTSGLTRVRATEQQARLDTRARHSNMRDAFAWQSDSPPPPRVLLVDDVLTTGSTVVACANALRAAGTRTVAVLALARSKPER